MNVLPHNIDAERAVLGGLMLDANRIHDVSDWLTSGDFYRRDHALIFQAITEQAAKGQPVDPVTLADWFAGVELGQHVGGLAYLVDLAQTTPSAANVTAYAEIVVEKARLRRLAEAGARISEQALAPNARPSADVAAEAEAIIREMAPATVGGLVSGKTAIQAAYAAFADRYEGNADLGLAWPWEGLTRACRLVPGEVTLLAARPSVGKSALAFQVALHHFLWKLRTAVFSLEMPGSSVINRMLAAHSGVDYGWIRQPQDQDESNTARVGAAMRELAACEQYLRIDDTAGLMAPQIVARCRRDHLRNSLGLVIIDHLHELRLSGKQGEVIERPEALREFKRMAKELKVPVLCLAQLSRAGATGAAPTLTDLRGSGGIEEVADTVLLLHRPDYYDPADRPGLIEVHVAKARDGERGVVVNLQNDYRRMRALDWVGSLPAPQIKAAPRWGKKDAA